MPREVHAEERRGRTAPPRRSRGHSPRRASSRTPRRSPRSAAVPWGSSGNDEPASAPAPSGDTSSRVDRRQQSIDITGKGPAVREQVMREQHRLSSLHVGVPRKRRVADLDRAIEQHLLQRDDAGGDHAELALAPEPQRGRDLVVAAPPGVQLAADLAGDLGDASLDRRVDVLVRGLELERPARRARRRRRRARRRSPRLRRRRATPPERGRGRARASPRCRPRPAAGRSAPTR